MSSRTVAVAIALLLAGAVQAQRPDPATFTDYKPDLPAAAVKRLNNRYPLSDQRNRGGWVRHAPMSDEFKGRALDTTRWVDHNPTWTGRQPAWFWPRNVKQEGGMLHLTMRKEEAPEAPRDKGYHTWTSAAVQSKGRVLYGYFEVRARAMKSHGSSAFWFYYSEPERWTEIDVFEIGGGAPGFERKQFITLHLFHTPTEKEHWSIGGIFEPSFNLADDYHVYGLEWDAQEMKFYFDGVLVRKGPNTHWHQALTLNLDSETMPDWFGLPQDKDLPSTFSIDYVRAWKRKGDAAGGN